MSSTRSPDPGGLPPHVPLVQMAIAHWQSAVIFAAAKLGLADHLAAGPLDPASLAAKCGAHAPSLARLLRTLAGLGVVTEGADHRFGLTAVGRALESGAPGAARATILTLASEPWVRGVAHLVDSVRSGRNSFDQVFGMPIFDWLGRHPDEAALFTETMIGFHGEEPAAIAAAFDFSPFRTIVDVGGASGLLLTTILARTPDSRGILFDLPHVVADAQQRLAGNAVAARLTTEGGSFFERVPTGGDAYLLSHVIHDWPEEQCLRILGHCRTAMNRGGRIALVEMVLPDGDAPHPGKMLDMMMLVGPGGQERTVTEYHALAGKAGLSIERIVPTASAVSLVVMKPA